jgi:hypothetical protein
MKFNLFPYVVAMSALFVSASAAFYSVYGLSNLFAGASTAVIIMASSLEFAKLVTASALYQYWDRVSLFLKAYLTTAIIVLIAITSAGIYGFLSGAYQETSTKEAITSTEIAILTSKQNRYVRDSEVLNANIMAWSEALANPTTIQYVDRETGQLVTTTSSRQRKALESQLVEARIAYGVASDSTSAIDLQILDLKVHDETTRELGPLKYVSTLIDKPMDSIINWFMLLIIFVFDPLAISLVIVANIAFGKIRKLKKLEPTIIPEVIVKKEIPNEGVSHKGILENKKDIASTLDLLLAWPTLRNSEREDKINEIKKNLYGEEEIK